MEREDLKHILSLSVISEMVCHQEIAIIVTMTHMKMLDFSQAINVLSFGTNVL
jgi:hypothetical protein